MGWTKNQQRVIDLEGKNLLVSAAAGSGKTSVLVERIKRLVEEKDADINSMLIVTFTNAAAGEMRTRLAKELSIDVSHADICTYDSFAQKLIKNYYHVIGIKPNLKICDEYKKSILANETVDEIFTELYDANDPNFIDFLDHYSDPKSDNVVREMIIAYCNYIDTLPCPEEYVEAIINTNPFNSEKLYKYAVDIVQSSIVLARKYTEELHAFLNSHNMPILAKKLLDDLSMFDSVLACFDDKHYDNGFALLSSTPRLATLKALKSEQLYKDEYSATIEAYREKVKKELKSAVDISNGFSIDLLEAENAALKPYIDTFLRLTLRFKKEFSKKKLADGLMDFSDEIHFALHILENEEVCKELSEKYDYIFVDEYQDSNLVQDTMISKIARQNNLFLVGDVKQSIYKFRNAEPELFLARFDAYKKGEKYSELINLNDNFRSKSTVINHVNKVFSHVMTKDSCGIVYDEDASLYEGEPKYTGELLEDPKMYLVSSEDNAEVDDSIDDLKSIELDAMLAASVVKKYYGKEYYDSKTKSVKTLHYRDMVILLRSAKGKAETYYQALANQGIPVYLQRNEGYFDAPEVQLVLNLLRVIDNFHQDIPLISVMHFPVFGFSADELARIRIFSNKAELRGISFADSLKYYQHNASDVLSEKVSAFIHQIEYWKLQSTALSLPDLIWTIIYDSNIINFISALRDSTQRIANVRALVDKASDFESNNIGGVFAFLSYIDIISSENAKVSTGQSKIANENDDVVRIMTIHNSKGLEFPFVMLAGVSSSLSNNRHGAQLKYHKDFGLSMLITSSETFMKVTPKSSKLISMRKLDEEYAEEIRVLYVAMTRAKDFLVYTACDKHVEDMLSKLDLYVLSSDKCNSYIEMIAPYIGIDNISLISKAELIAENDTTKNELDLKDNLKNGFDISRSLLSISSDDILSRLSYDYTPRLVEKKKKKYSVSEIVAEERLKASDAAYSENEEYSIPSFFDNKHRSSSAAIGTGYHLVMERLPFDERAKDINYIKAFISDLVNKGLLDEDLYESIVPERIVSFFNSDLGQMAIESNNLLKEQSFTVLTEYDDRMVSIQGTIDCYFETQNGELILVDYKSNYVDKLDTSESVQKLVENYKPQLRLYKQALERITKQKVSKSFLFLFSIGEAIEVSI